MEETGKKRNDKTYLEKEILFWFASIQGISDKRKIQILERLEDILLIEDIMYLKEHPLLGILDDEIDTIKKEIKRLNRSECYEKAEKEHIKLVTYFEEAYPKQLHNIHNPPFGIFYKGRLPDFNKLSIAIVGARACSAYGEAYAKEYAKVLAVEGIPVISGMALGIDGIGQRSAIDAGGESYAIIGSGVDYCYPPKHKGLYLDLIESGGVLSEYPPGTAPKPYHFPMRNRIISGLSDALLVIEAKERSGSLITAMTALEQGKDVYALPGPVNSQLSRGCNRLIKDGAGILLSPQELLKELGIMCTLTKKNNNKNYLPLDNLEKLVYSCLDLQPKNIQRIFDETKVPISQLLSTLIALDLKGYVSEITKNNYVKVI